MGKERKWADGLLTPEETRDTMNHCSKGDFRWVYRGIVQSDITPEVAQHWVRRIQAKTEKGGKIEAQRSLGSVKQSAQLLIRKDRHGGQVTLTSIGKISDEPLDWRLVDGQHRLSLVAAGDTPIQFSIRVYHCSTEKDAAALFSVMNDGKHLQRLDKLRALFVNEDPVIRKMAEVFPEKYVRDGEEDLGIFARSWSGRPNATQILLANHIAMFRSKGRANVFDPIYNTAMSKPEDIERFGKFWKQFSTEVEKQPEDMKREIYRTTGRVMALALIYAYWVEMKGAPATTAYMVQRIAESTTWRQYIKVTNPARDFSLWDGPVEHFAMMLYPGKQGKAAAAWREVKALLVSDDKTTREFEKRKLAREGGGAESIGAKVGRAIELQDPLYNGEAGREERQPLGIAAK